MCTTKFGGAVGALWTIINNFRPASTFKGSTYTWVLNVERFYILKDGSTDMQIALHAAIYSIHHAWCKMCCV